MSENLESLGKCQCGAEGTTWDDDHFLLCQLCLKDCQIDALTAQLADAGQIIADDVKIIVSMSARLEEKDKYIEPLITYTAHKPFCKDRRALIAGAKCNCGLQESLDKIAALKGG